MWANLSPQYFEILQYANYTVENDASESRSRPGKRRANQEMRPMYRSILPIQEKLIIW